MIFLEGKMEMSFFKLRISNIPSHVLCVVCDGHDQIFSTNGEDTILIVNCYLSICKSGGGQWHYWYYAGSGATLPHGSLAIIIIYAGNTALHLPGGPEAVRETQNFCQNNPGVWTKLIWLRDRASRSPGPMGEHQAEELVVWHLAPGLASLQSRGTRQWSFQLSVCRCLLVFLMMPLHQLLVAINTFKTFSVPN